MDKRNRHMSTKGKGSSHKGKKRRRKQVVGGKGGKTVSSKKNGGSAKGSGVKSKKGGKKGGKEKSKSKSHTHTSANEPVGGRAKILKIPFEKLVEQEPVGAGQFALVYRAVWKSSKAPELESKRKYVAIKYAKKDMLDQRDLLKEIRLLSRMRHENIMRVYGVTTDNKGRRGAVMSYVPWTLNKVLGDVDPVQVALDVAKGMKYLHEKKFLHMDLKPDNVLITKAGRGVVSDFGLAGRVGLTTPTGAGTEGYMAPEVRAVDMAGRPRYSYPVDVYSYGKLLVDIKARNDNTPEALKKLAKRCIKHDPDERPSFRQIVKFLKKLKLMSPAPQFSSSGRVLSSTPSDSAGDPHGSGGLIPMSFAYQSFGPGGPMASFAYQSFAMHNAQARQREAAAAGGRSSDNSSSSYSSAGSASDDGEGTTATASTAASTTNSTVTSSSVVSSSTSSSSSSTEQESSSVSSTSSAAAARGQRYAASSTSSSSSDTPVVRKRRGKSSAAPPGKKGGASKDGAKKKGGCCC